MSTDTVIVVQQVAEKLREHLRSILAIQKAEKFEVISHQSRDKIETLLQDAIAKGATVMSREDGMIVAPDSTTLPVTFVEGLSTDMDLFWTETFGSVIGLKVVDSEEEAIEVASTTDYGLSAAIWTKDHHRALQLAPRLNVGAVHVNGSTVHDEATLPHGGCGYSGYGRFGGAWGLKEFVQTQTIMLNY
jgi:acyl-CoA reductase-like NAD-dependent aldehyde dehydrogenase